MIQNIEKQYDNWHIVFNDTKLCFTVKPILLYHGFMPVEPNCTNGLRWRVKGKWLSYKQIKSAIKSHKQPKQITHNLSIFGINISGFVTPYANDQLK